MKCRFCQNELRHEFIDLLSSPPSNSFLTAQQLNEPEMLYPLKVFVCDKCFLVQIEEYKKSDEIFNEKYAYFSSYSSSWLEHSRKYVDMITERLSLNKGSHVIEIASNDGYLLQYFVEKNISCIGIEPTACTAEAAKEKGIAVVEDFFGVRIAGNLRKADLILGNNVLAHVPDINDFVKGLKIALNPQGTVTMEFPHLLNLIKYTQFDTIYHEHFSYFSFLAVENIFRHHGLKIFDVEELSTHGGSLRIYATHAENDCKINGNVESLRLKEKNSGIHSIKYYEGFHTKVQQIKYDFLRFLLEAKKNGKKVAAYGAAAKGNTLLNYCGIKGTDLIPFVVDKSPHKQERFLPGSHIPVVSAENIKEYKPDFLIILPWNISEEIVNEHSYINEWGGKFVVFIPKFLIKIN
jgi:SAM-dependent methyltransferase